MEYQPSIALKEFMFQFISDDKVRRFNEIVNNRTRYFTIVLEDVFQAQNTNAVIRSCECFGIQDLHLIENKYDFEVVPDISKGSSQWINIQQYNQALNNTKPCLRHLKNQGYTIIGTSPHQNEINLEDISIDNKTAFVLGSEKDGLSQEAKEICDGFMKIPMVGFTESLNFMC
jgi:tRNA (guanosine-2'-O-)-methyltransferase